MESNHGGLADDNHRAKASGLDLQLKSVSILEFHTRTSVPGLKLKSWIVFLCGTQIVNITD
jgi:hypothetical protein